VIFQISNKFTYVEVKDYVENLGYELISNRYKDCFSKLVLKDKSGYYYTVILSNLKQGEIPRKFDIKNPYTINNIKLWCKLNNKPFVLKGNVYKNSYQKLEWICLKNNCGEKFKTNWNSIHDNKGCPYCSGKKVSLSNCLATKNPDLAKQWHPTKNGDLTPYNVTCGSNKKVWWLCNEDHEWKVKISNRNNGNGCPYCTGQLPSKNYNLVVFNSDLCKEWNYEKNNKKPEEYTPISGQKVWWICNKNSDHVWKAVISNRNNGSSCPYCSGRLSTKENNLFVANPKLCEEWDYNKNKKKPEEYLPFSNKKVWWTCKECGYEWKTIISHRNIGSNCPQCNESKGEKIIREYLTTYNFNFEPQYKFDNLLSSLGNQLRFDFAILDKQTNNLKLLIEYDGVFHYNKYYKEQNFEVMQHHDQLKNQYCQQHNIPLLRIPYWDYNNIEEILTNYLKEMIK
jgi:hypothetical protein